MGLFEEFVASYKPHVLERLQKQILEGERKMAKKFEKKTWRVTGGRYSYDEEDTMTREEADALAQSKAAGNYDQVQVWELVGTVQNKLPVDLLITPIA